MQPASSTSRFLAAAIAAALLPAVVQADPTNAELLQKIEELSQKVLVLERRLEVQDEATKTAATTAPVVKASPRGFSIASADSKNQLKLRGVMHLDGRFFGSDDPEGLKDTWQATRVRPFLPCRPSKLRLLVDAQRSPGASMSSFIARHIEQPASRHSNPASVNMRARPSSSACFFICIDPGTTIALTRPLTVCPFTTFAASRRSSIREFVHEPINARSILI